MRTVTQRYILKTIFKAVIFLAISCALTLTALFATVFVIARGPSAEASERFAATLLEARSPFARLFYSDDELSRAAVYIPPVYIPSEITFAVDADGNRIGYTPTSKIIEVKGKSWKGLIFEGIDPLSLTLMKGADSRVVEENAFAMPLYSDAPPMTLIGDEFFYTEDAGICACGIDGQGILSAGRMSAAAVFNSGWRFALAADRILVNGSIPLRSLGGGYGARAAMGQKADGSVIMLFVIPRGIYPHGATYDEIASIMFEYGSVTAVSLPPCGDGFAVGVRAGEKSKSARLYLGFSAPECNIEPLAGFND